MKSNGDLKSPFEICMEEVNLWFTPHGYQEEDINRLSVDTSCGVFLDLGLGKTFVSIMIGLYKIITGEHDRCYVICPQSLITQWYNTLTRMHLSAASYRGTPKQRKKIDREVDFLVMSYEIFRTDYEVLKRHDTFIIVDEATILCNRKNIFFLMLQGGIMRKVKKIPGQLMPEVIEREFEGMNHGCALLTATPMNKPEDAYGLIKILTPDTYDNYQQFLRIHVKTFDNFERPEDYDNLELLKENLMKFATLRHASDHIDLPPIVFKTVHYDLAPKHLALYRKLLKERMLRVSDKILIDADSAAAMYNWAQRIITQPDPELYDKEPACFELTDQVMQSVDNALIFNRYKQTNAAYMERYDAGGCFGLIPPVKQSEYIEAFKARELDVLVCNPKSGGFGLDLPMCQNILVPELPVTPRDFRQMCGRCHRQGQKETVVVTIFIARRTIQESIFKRFLKSDDITNSIIQAKIDLTDELISARMSKAELLAELSGDGGDDV